MTEGGTGISQLWNTDSRDFIEIKIIRMIIAGKEVMQFDST